MKKKTLMILLAMVMSFAMVMAFTACGGSSDSGGEGEEAASSGDGITIFNSKNEIQDEFEKLAAAYTEETGVPVEVYYSQDTVAAHLATKYASNEPYTINMVDAKDVYSLGKEYGADMSGQEWVEDTDYAITVDDKVLGFPVCIECRGILYNADAVKETLGKDFDPTSIVTLDDFKAFCDELVKGGMESPTAILKPDWSLAAHYLQQVYEEREDPDAFVQDLYDGKVT
jgi:raffinose/stachyose/melibiose transport system substrate-binding protein